VKLARNDLFCRTFGIPQYTETDENEYYENPERQENNLYRTMGDCQIILRFFALLDEESIRGSMRNILDNCMKRHQKALPETLSEYEVVFKLLISACDRIFEGQPFSLPPDEKGKQRISIALFDACMVALYRRREHIERYVEKGGEISTAVGQALRTNLELLTGKANTAQSIKDRIGAIGRILDGIS
jgi:hypothetical protein